MRGLPYISIKEAEFRWYEQKLAERIHNIIQSEYAGHPFNVTVSIMQMRAIIDHPMLPTGYAITVKLTEEDPDGKIYLKFCGELLERMGVPRGPLVDGALWIDPEKCAAAISDIK